MTKLSRLKKNGGMAQICCVIRGWVLVKIRDLYQSIVIIVLFVAMWIVPIAVEKIVSPEFSIPLQGNKVTLVAGKSRVEVTVPSGFSKNVSPKDSHVTLEKGDIRLSFHLASGVENQERSIERGLVILNRQQGSTKWRGEEIRVADAVNDMEGQHDLVGKGCEIEQTPLKKCAVVGAGKFILTIISTDEQFDPVDLVRTARGTISKGGKFDLGDGEQ